MEAARLKPTQNASSSTSNYSCIGTLHTALVVFFVTVPYALPLSPLLFVNKIRLGRNDLLWLSGVVLLGAVSFVTWSFRIEMVVLLFGFLAFKGGEVLFGLSYKVGTVRALRIVLAIFVLWAVLETVLGSGARASGPAWFGHTNVFALVVVAVGLTVSAHSTGIQRWLMLAGTVATVVMAGSRSALLGIVVGLGVAALLDRDSRRFSIVFLGLVFATVLYISLLLPGRPWAQRLLSPLYSAVGVERLSKNLIVDTESLIDSQRWNALGVVSESVSRDGTFPSEWKITRVEPVPWARPQQVVVLERGIAYTLSGAFEPMSSSETPGFIGWLSQGDARAGFETAIVDGEARLLSSTGLDHTSLATTDIGDGWQLLSFTFTLIGHGRAQMAIGVSPGVGSARIGDHVVVRAVQLEVGAIATSYEPAIQRSTGVGEALARVELARVALEGIAESPLVGHGSHTFTAYYGSRASDRTAPSHAHNFVLDVAFRSGVLGLIAYALALPALIGSAGPHRISLLATIGVANIFDATLISGPAIYTFAFVVGSYVGMASNRSLTRLSSMTQLLFCEP